MGPILDAPAYLNVIYSNAWPATGRGGMYQNGGARISHFPSSLKYDKKDQNRLKLLILPLSAVTHRRAWSYKEMNMV